MTRARRLVAAACALAAAALAGPAGAQEATLGGGSTLESGTVVPVAAGEGTGSVHRIFADNREQHPITVAFRADAPAGIVVTPERERFTIAPGTSEEVAFSIAAESGASPGDRRVVVQLVRDDIEARPGVVTAVPAVGTVFTVRVSGEAATVTVRAVSAQSGRPVEGTLSLVALVAGRRVEVARTAGTTLSATVAPGDYEAAYGLGGRQLAQERVSVAAGEHRTVTLQVDTVSFVLVGAEPVTEGGRVVVVELVAAVENHLEALERPATITAEVVRDGRALETVTVHQLPSLPLGVSEGRLTYRPDGGFRPGDYEVRYRLAAGDLVLEATEPATFAVGGDSDGRPWRAAVVGVLALAAVATWLARVRPRMV